MTTPNPRGYPRTTWPDNLVPPSTWNRDHWSFDESKKTRRRPAAKRAKLINQALEFLNKIAKQGK